MTERTEREESAERSRPAEGHEGMPSQLSMTERTEREGSAERSRPAEGHEASQRSMTERTERTRACLVGSA